jgi:hypothetical protein
LSSCWRKYAPSMRGSTRQSIFLKTRFSSSTSKYTFVIVSEEVDRILSRHLWFSLDMCCDDIFVSVGGSHFSLEEDNKKKVFKNEMSTTEEDRMSSQQREGYLSMHIAKPSAYRSAGSHMRIRSKIASASHIRIIPNHSVGHQHMVSRVKAKVKAGQHTSMKIVDDLIGSDMIAQQDAILDCRSWS